MKERDETPVNSEFNLKAAGERDRQRMGGGGEREGHG